MVCDHAEEELLELQEEFAQRLGQADRTIQELRDDKAKLHQQLQQANMGGSATEAKVAELQDSIDRLRCASDADDASTNGMQVWRRTAGVSGLMPAANHCSSLMSLK